MTVVNAANGESLRADWTHFWIDVSLTMAKGVVGAAALYRFATQDPPDNNAVKLFGSALLLVVGIEVVAHIRAHRKRYAEKVKAAKREAMRLSVDPLDAALDALHSVIVSDRASGKHGLRVCLWEPDGNGNLRQLTEYAGAPPKNYRGRLSPVTCGIIGLVYRTKLAVVKVAQRSQRTDVSFVDQMMNEFGYPEEAARELRSDRQAWAAIAIGDPDAPLAVLYLDSRQREFFGSKNGCAQRAIQSACVSIAGHLARRQVSEYDAP